MTEDNKTQEKIELEINKRVNSFFAEMIDTLPKSKYADTDVTGKGYLAKTENNKIINYEEVLSNLKIIAASFMENVKDYREQNYAKIILKVVTGIPKVITNVRNFKTNYQIRHIQNEIITKYFADTSSELNLEARLDDLKLNMDNYVAAAITMSEDDGLKLVNSALNRFEEKIIKPFIEDLKTWVNLLDKRR